MSIRAILAPAQGYLCELPRNPKSELLASQLHIVGQFHSRPTVMGRWFYLDEKVVAFPVLRQVVMDDFMIEAIVWYIIIYPLRRFGIRVRHG